jgi:hypothetical protein
MGAGGEGSGNPGGVEMTKDVRMDPNAINGP